MVVEPTFAEAASQMLAQMRAANEPVKAATFRSTESRLRAINEILGAKPISEIRGVDVKNYIAKRVTSGLSGSTVNSEYQIIRKVIESIVDDNLQCVYPIKWVTRNLDLPSVKPSIERTPCTAPLQIETAVAMNINPYSQLVAFLAITGLRVGEGAACRIGSADPAVTHWDSELSLIRVRTSFDLNEHSAKTVRSANRIVDLCTEANDYLKFCAGDRRGGFLFSENDGPLNRNRLYRAAAKLCGPYHGLRRARITHLYRHAATPAHEQLIKFWVGHESHETSQTERYSKLWQDTQWRREFAERAGIGFKLPAFAEPRLAPGPQRDLAMVAP